jgi:WD40 repeat protein
LLATASWDKRIRLIDFFSGGKPVTLGVGIDKHSDSVVSIAFATAGDVLVSSGTDQLVKLWDVERKRLILNYKTEDDRPVEKVAFFPNQYDFAMDKYSSDVSLWDITNEGHLTNTLIDLKDFSAV